MTAFLNKPFIIIIIIIITHTHTHTEPCLGGSGGNTFLWSGLFQLANPSPLFGGGMAGVFQHAI